MEIDKREVLRYLGYGNREADPETEKLIDSCCQELLEAARPRFLMGEYPLDVSEQGMVDCACFQTVSRNLAGNLSGCDRVLIMAATLGSEVDRLLTRYGKYQVSRAVTLQAAATAMIESFCDGLCCQWKAEYEPQGYYLRPRFSPGYGDFSIICQVPILDTLETGKRVGITLTDSFLMLPSKSVTAVIGLGRRPFACQTKGCGSCQKQDCAYRRD